MRITFLKDGATLIQLPGNLIFLSNGSISSDQGQIIFQACDYQQHCVQTPLILITVSTGEYTVPLSGLIQPAGKQKTFISSFQWIDDTHIRLIFKDEANIPQQWVLNLASGGFKQETPQATVTP